MTTQTIWPVIDEFLPEWERARAFFDTADFKDEKCEDDGVVYPYICGPLPDWMEAQIKQRLFDTFGSPVEFRYLFARLSPAGVRAPHQAHNDVLMGQFTLILYMNRLEHSKGSTEFVVHKGVGMQEGPQTSEEEEIWRRDMNDEDAWDVVASCNASPNRALVFPSRFMHRAKPIGGYGTTNHDARLVIVGFFNVLPF